MELFSHESNFFKGEVLSLPIWISRNPFRDVISYTNWIYYWQLSQCLMFHLEGSLPLHNFSSLSLTFSQLCETCFLHRIKSAERQHNFSFSAFNMSTFYFRSSCKIKSLVMISSLFQQISFRRILKGHSLAPQSCSEVVPEMFFWNIIKSKDIFWRGFGSGFWTCQSLFGNIRDGSESAAASFTHSFH